MKLASTRSRGSVRKEQKLEVAEVAKVAEPVIEKTKKKAKSGSKSRK